MLSFCQEDWEKIVCWRCLPVHFLCVLEALLIMPQDKTQKNQKEGAAEVHVFRKCATAFPGATAMAGRLASRWHAHTHVSGSRRVARVQRTHTHERLVSSTWRALRLTLWQLGFSGEGFERRKCYFIFPLQKPRGVQIVATSCFRNAYANSLALLLLFSLSLSPSLPILDPSLAADRKQIQMRRYLGASADIEQRKRGMCASALS